MIAKLFVVSIFVGCLMAVAIAIEVLRSVDPFKKIRRGVRLSKDDIDKCFSILNRRK